MSKEQLEDKNLASRVELFHMQAEQIVLGTIILNNEYLNRVSEFLLPEHFYEPSHQKIYSQIIYNVEKTNIVANQVTLKQFFENEASVKAMGGANYLSTLLASASAIVDIANYGRMIHDLAVKRELVMIGEDIVNKAFKLEERTTADEQIEQAESKLFGLTNQGAGKSDFRNISTSLKETLDKTIIARKRDSHISGVSTGLADLDKMLGGMQNSDLIILAGRPSMGKAQPLDAKILTAKDGFKKMGELKIGDELASIDGAPSIVQGIFPQGEKEIHKITFSDGRSTECCAEHLWSVNYRDWDAPKILETKKIIEMLSRKRYQDRIWIDNVSGDFGHNEKLPINPWLLGALLGDAKLTEGTIIFSTASKEMLNRVAATSGAELTVKHSANYDYRIIQTAGSHQKGIQGVSPNPLTEKIKNLGLHGLRSQEKFIPEKYLNANRQARLELLQGLIDTDGWVEKFGAVRFCSTSKNLAKQVVYLARSLGGVATLKEKNSCFTYKGEKRIGRLSYVVNISHSDPASLMTLTHKKERLLKGRTRQKRLTISKIELVKKDLAQCISVSHKSHLYITDNYVVTHNTALAINIAVNAVKFLNKDVEDPKDKKSVGFFSLEMSADQLSARILSMESSINSTKFRTGQLNDVEWEAIAMRSAEISKWPFFIDDTPALSISAIRTRTRRMIRKHNLAFLLIDYLQLVKAVDSRGRGMDNRVQEISEITQGLKAIAKEFQIPVIALSQLSRQVEQREDKRPQLSDLRESGSIEQDADVVTFIYRESYYHERKMPPEADIAKFEQWKSENNRLRNLSEVIIAKQRNGPIGHVQLFFDAEFTRFGNLDIQHAPREDEY